MQKGKLNLYGVEVYSNELNPKLAQILVPEAYSSSPAPQLLPYITAAIKESSLDRPIDLATTLWYKNRTHADWGLVAWKATVPAAASRTWDPSVTDDQMAERFASLVQNIDCHLPDGIEKVVVTWFETTGSQELMFVDDATWMLVKDMLLRLALNGVIIPQTILSGMVYPVWQRVVQSRTKVDALAPALVRSMELVRSLLCYPTSSNGTIAVSAEQELEWETCRARCFRPGHLSTILDGLAALSVFEHDYVADEGARNFLQQFRKEIAQGPSFRNEIPPRTNLVRSALAKATLEYPEHRAIFCNIIRRSVNWESLGRWSIGTLLLAHILHALYYTTNDIIKNLENRSQCRNGKMSSIRLGFGRFPRYSSLYNWSWNSLSGNWKVHPTQLLNRRLTTLSRTSLWRCWSTIWLPQANP
jgi:hypothetical protein